MSELLEAVEKLLQREKDHDATVNLWRRVWARYEQGDTEGVQDLIDGLLILPGDGE